MSARRNPAEYRFRQACRCRVGIVRHPKATQNKVRDAENLRRSVSNLDTLGLAGIKSKIQRGAVAEIGVPRRVAGVVSSISGTVRTPRYMGLLVP